jgi:hypothetical protein
VFVVIAVSVCVLVPLSDFVSASRRRVIASVISVAEQPSEWSVAGIALCQSMIPAEYRDCTSDVADIGAVTNTNSSSSDTPSV